MFISLFVCWHIILRKVHVFIHGAGGAAEVSPQTWAISLGGLVCVCFAEQPSLSPLLSTPPHNDSKLVQQLSNNPTQRSWPRWRSTYCNSFNVQWLWILYLEVDFAEVNQDIPLTIITWTKPWWRVLSSVSGKIILSSRERCRSKVTWYQLFSKNKFKHRTKKSGDS